MIGTQANVSKLGELELGVRWADGSKLVATEPELFYYRVVLHIYFRISLLSCILYHVAWKALILSSRYQINGSNTGSYFPPYGKWP